MAYRDKEKEKAYAREYYRKNRERILKRNRQGDDDEEVNCCRYCVRFSRTTGDRRGWCMKHRRTVGANDVCQSFRAEVKFRYEYPVHAVAIFEGE